MQANIPVCLSVSLLFSSPPLIRSVSALAFTRTRKSYDNTHRKRPNQGPYRDTSHPTPQAKRTGPSITILRACVHAPHGGYTAPTRSHDHTTFSCESARDARTGSGGSQGQPVTTQFTWQRVGIRPPPSVASRLSASVQRALTRGSWESRGRGALGVESRAAAA